MESNTPELCPVIRVCFWVEHDSKEGDHSDEVLLLPLRPPAVKDKPLNTPSVHVCVGILKYCPPSCCSTTVLTFVQVQLSSALSSWKPLPLSPCTLAPVVVVVVARQ